jgi:hypothetical protein
MIPVVEPSIDIKEINENHVVFKFMIITKPEVKVTKYTALGVKKEKPTVSAEEIANEIKQKHIKKSGEFLVNSNRFKNFEINELEVIKNLYSCFEEEKFSLNKELLLTHSGNLGIDQLIELFNDLGIKNSKAKILGKKKFVEYIKNKNELSKYEEDRIISYIEDNFNIVVLAGGKVIEDFKWEYNLEEKIIEIEITDLNQLPSPVVSIALYKLTKRCEKGILA